MTAPFTPQFFFFDLLEKAKVLLLVGFARVFFRAGSISRLFARESDDRREPALGVRRRARGGSVAAAAWSKAWAGCAALGDEAADIDEDF